jgi:hypothetical protein
MEAKPPGSPGGLKRILSENDCSQLSEKFLIQITDEYQTMEQNNTSLTVELERKEREISFLKTERARVDGGLYELNEMVKLLKLQLAEQKKEVSSNANANVPALPLTKDNTFRRSRSADLSKSAQTSRSNSPISSPTSSPKAIGTSGMFKAKALFSNFSTNTGVRQLHFSKGDIIEVLERHTSGMWMGRNKQNQHGYFPRNLVKIIG